MRIREGDSLEIFTEKDGEVIFKKYSPIAEINGIAADYADALYKTAGLAVAVFDRDGVVASAGVPKKELADKAVSKELEQLCEKRAVYTYGGSDERLRPTSEGKHFIVCAAPIVSGGDVGGCVTVLSREDAQKRACTEVEQKLAVTAAAFMAKQLDS